MSSNPPVSSNSPAFFIQVPPAPYDITGTQSLSARHVPASTNNPLKALKENTPLTAPRISMLQSASTSSSSLKRKASNSDSLSSGPADGTPSASNKKPKPTGTATPLKLSQINSPARNVESSSNACPEYPNGWTYCHQCCKKRDLTATIHCTFVEEKHVKRSTVVKHQRCVAKYCKPCLQNRYGQDIEDLRRNKKWETGHIENAGYSFKCPKCRDECNCPRCRKSKGLDPIGTMRQPETAAEKKEKKEREKQAKKESASADPKKRARKPKPKVLPRVKWTRIAPGLSRSEVEERMNIREFCLRFNDLSNSGLLKPQLEELEQINGKYNGQDGHDPGSWVSDATLKAVVTMLLGIVAESDSPYAAACEDACKNLRNIGFSPMKVWTILQEWQESINNAAVPTSDEDASPEPFSLAEPHPPSEFFWTQARRSTRTLGTAQDTLVVHSSAQMVPTILSLIDFVLPLSNVRDSLEEGIKESKEIVRKSREALKLESERWDAVKKQIEPSKDKLGFQAAKRLHKLIVAALEASISIAHSESIQRFAPLGTDPEGRAFYALTPGHSEREAAYEFTEVLSGELGVTQKLKKKGRTLKLSEREDQLDWSWMILVWGKKPPSAFTPLEEDEDGDTKMEEEEEEEEGWWCFSEPEDIKKLAEWLALANDLEDEKKDSKSASTNGAAATVLDSEQLAVKAVVGSLKDFGTLLEWRLREEKYQLPGPLPSKMANGSTAGSAKGRMK